MGKKMRGESDWVRMLRPSTIRDPARRCGAVERGEKRMDVMEMLYSTDFRECDDGTVGYHGFTSQLTKYGIGDRDVVMSDKDLEELKYALHQRFGGTWTLERDYDMMLNIDGEVLDRAVDFHGNIVPIATFLKLREEQQQEYARRTLVESLDNAKRALHSAVYQAKETIPHHEIVKMLFDILCGVVNSL